jgi:hypothetical protein
MTPLEIAQLIFELLTLAGLVAIAVGGVLKITDPESLPLYMALTFTAIVAAFLDRRDDAAATVNGRFQSHAGCCLASERRANTKNCRTGTIQLDSSH